MRTRSFDNRGLSLVEILIMASILSVILFTTINMIANLQKAQSDLNEQFGVTSTMVDINRILNNVENCNVFLDGLNPRLSFSSALPADRVIRNGGAAGSVRYKTASSNVVEGANRYEGGIEIESFHFRDYQASGIATNDDSVELVVRFKSTRNSDKAGYARSFPVYLNVTGGIINGCSSSVRPPAPPPAGPVPQGGDGAPYADAWQCTCTGDTDGGNNGRVTFCVHYNPQGQINDIWFGDIVVSTRNRGGICPRTAPDPPGPDPVVSYTIRRRR